MATNPKNSEWIYGTQANYVRTQRERRDDAISKSMNSPLPLPKINYPIDPVPSARSVSPTLYSTPSAPDVQTGSFRRGRQTSRPAGKPTSVTNVVALIGGVLGATYAAAHGANTAMGMGISFVVSFVVAGVLFHYAKWVMAVLFVVGVVYALTH